jgi:hypothetical protein
MSVNRNVTVPVGSGVEASIGSPSATVLARRTASPSRSGDRCGAGGVRAARLPETPITSGEPGPGGSRLPYPSVFLEVALGAMPPIPAATRKRLGPSEGSAAGGGGFSGTAVKRRAAKEIDGGRVMSNRRTLFAVIFPLLFGLWELFDVVNKPRFATYHGSDVVQLVGAGMLLGIALSALFAFLLGRRSS